MSKGAGEIISGENWVGENECVTEWVWVRSLK